MSNSLKYRSEIDGLRCFAVMPVLFFHSGFSLFSGGFVGVDVFFVISGFLITKIIILEGLAGKFSYAHFYERRARRIFPALAVTILASIAIAPFILPRDESINFGKSIIAVMLFASNIFFWKNGNYFDGVSDEKPLLHTWSLAVEEQFYLILPLFLLPLLRTKLGWRTAALSAACLFSFLLCLYGSKAMPSAAFYLIPFRAWELLVGSVIASVEVSRSAESASPVASHLTDCSFG